MGKKPEITEEQIQMFRASQAVRMGVNEAANDTLNAYIKWRLFGLSHFFAIVSSCIILTVGWKPALWYFGIYFFFSIFAHRLAMMMNLLTWLTWIGFSAYWFEFVNK